MWLLLLNAGETEYFFKIRAFEESENDQGKTYLRD